MNQVMKSLATYGSFNFIDIIKLAKMLTCRTLSLPTYNKFSSTYRPFCTIPQLQCLSVVPNHCKVVLTLNTFYPTSKCCIHTNYLHYRKVFENPYEEMLKKKKTVSPTIILIDTNERATFISLEKAEILAKKQDLKLVKIEDPKRYAKGENKSIYQLMTGKQFHEETQKNRDHKKSVTTDIKDEKAILINSSIYHTDLDIKIKKMKGWIEKRHQIKATIIKNAEDASKVTEVCNRIEAALKEEVKALEVIKQPFGGGLKMSISPPRKKDKLDNSS